MDMCTRPKSCPGWVCVCVRPTIRQTGPWAPALHPARLFQQVRMSAEESQLTPGWREVPSRETTFVLHRPSSRVGGGVGGKREGKGQALPQPSSSSLTDSNPGHRPEWHRASSRPHSAGVHLMRHQVAVMHMNCCEVSECKSGHHVFVLGAPWGVCPQSLRVPVHCRRNLMLAGGNIKGTRWFPQTQL